MHTHIVGIRSLQCILLKLCLLLGVKIYHGVEFLEILEPNEQIGWHAKVEPEDHAVSQFQFDFIVGKWLSIFSAGNSDWHGLFHVVDEAGTNQWSEINGGRD